MHEFLFICGQHNAGTSALTRLIGSSPIVSLLPYIEGASLYKRREYLGPHDTRHGLPRLLCENLEVFGDYSQYDWLNIKRRWMNDWDKDCKVLCEKSPTYNIILAPKLQKVFEGAKLLCIMRDPYAVSEGLRRRLGENNGKKISLERAATNWVECARLTKLNLETLEQIDWVRYEDVTENPQLVEDVANGLLANKIKIDFKASVSQWGHFHNRNRQQLSRLKPQDIEEISSVLEKESELLSFFGYALK